ncbi:MAG: DUF1800 domain-containing protein [Pseudomonadota bacterium]
MAADLKHAAIALNRFGLGARPDEPLPADPQRWLLGQFERYASATPLWSSEPSGTTIVASYVDYLAELRQADAAGDVAIRQKLRAQSLDRYRAGVQARVTAALDTPAPFAERLVHFWANHFAVSIEKPPLTLLAGSLEAEAIRPHIFGRFEDMLLAVERHPAMLIYLDQIRSIGPESRAGQRSAMANPLRPRGLNENLAREILELHTLGVRTGYTQQDVTEFAKALTGWTLGGFPGLPGGGERGAFAFQSALHEPGSRVVLGQRYDQQGEAQAAAVLHTLATAPATARHLCMKLARHFAGDTPPASLVDRLAETFLRTAGDLSSVYRTLIESPEAWTTAQTKFKTPWEWTLSSLRGLRLREAGSQPLATLIGQLGQPVWRPGSPAGYDDIAESWAAPDALMRRVEFAQRIAERAGSSVDARTLAPHILPGGISAGTAMAIARAESSSSALALLLASPEFLRR